MQRGFTVIVVKLWIEILNYLITFKHNFNMKFTFSKDFETDRYTACLAEIGQLIEQLRKESGCSMKPVLASVHISHLSAKGVCPDVW